MVIAVPLMLALAAAAAAPPTLRLDLYHSGDADEEHFAVDRAEPHARAVGAFEGANYQAKGMYRAQADCIMFSRNDVPFCAACRSAIERVLDQYTRK